MDTAVQWETDKNANEAGQEIGWEKGFVSAVGWLGTHWAARTLS